ncbi:uncharacterized protein LOC119840085 isoform X2 [Zerene cesonia]|uniref:uncharacterized protein LOC119840085 isoform X2 n=1 Tax=Zerene cesonia TaxID=33412 RepID=UPI0018E50825|nr:uncharacterized protein LOC119840085 isoform X2 [Zerene cesonia]
MDNHLTPNRIQRLIHLAEDKSFNLPRRIAQSSHDDTNRSIATNHTPFNKTNCESSSGILDLERVQGFGESGIGNMSLSKSSAFNPGEMTGRSTGADDLHNPAPLGATRLFEDYGRHSVALDSITSHMDRQTSEINDLMRHSIATNYSFNGKRDLTADEASLVMREAPMPVQQSTEVNFQDSIMSNSNMSVGAYFKNKCPMLVNILGNTDSPDRSMNPSITEVSSHVNVEATPNKQNNTYKIDPSLDSVPVRQPKSINFETYDPATKNTNELNYVVPKPTENRIISSLKSEKSIYKGLEPEISLNKSTMKAEVSIPLPKAVDALKTKAQSSFKLPTEETESSLENSLSISKIADYIRRQSNLSVTDMLQLNNQMKQMNRKQPLSELQMNLIDNKQNNQEVYVTNLIDSKKMETASSSSSVKTVISQDKLKIHEKNVPSVIITKDSLDAESVELRNLRTPRMARSKSPSSKSQSTLTTVHENRSFKSSNSPLHSSKEQWVEILTKPVEGYVGVSEAVVIEITTLTQTWLTAKIQFESLPNGGKDLTVELPRQPLLLSPGKTEKFTLYITSNIEINSNLPFVIHLKDASIDGDFEQKGCLEVDIKMPSIQAVSCDGVNKISFPLIQEKTSLTKYIVLLSDCQADLQLELSIMTGDSMFMIKNVQEIKKSDVSKALMERQASSEDQQKSKGKLINKLLCRLSGGNAIKVTIMFNSPKLSDLGIIDKMATFKGCLNVNLIGVNTVLKKVNLLASVGTAHLEVDTTVDKIVISSEPTSVTVYNTGTIPGAWLVMFKCVNGDTSIPFKVSASRIEVRPGESKQIHVVYTGPQDVANDGKLVLEEVTTSTKTEINITGGSEKPKSFPIKTNFNNMSWVRAGRKQLSLKNATNKKIQIRCQIVGDGFTIDCPGSESRGTYLLSFGPCECRPLPILFSPPSCMPFAASLHLVYDKNSDFSRKVKLHGCAAEGEGVRWSGALVTYGETALVRAARRRPVDLALYNRAAAPAFVAVSVHFNLQYRSLAEDAELVGARRVVGRRAAHAVSLRVRWPRVERRAPPARSTALASLTVLAGPELTRRRILKILRDEGNGQLDTSLLPDRVKVLAEEFEGEDPSMDNYLESFSETKASLNELIESLQELTAQIDLPQDFSEDNTILISDDTMIDHHTLCE